MADWNPGTILPGNGFAGQIGNTYPSYNCSEINYSCPLVVSTYLGLEHGLDIHQHGSGHQNPRARIILLPPPGKRRRQTAPARTPAATVLLGPVLMRGSAIVVYAPDVLLPPRRRPPAPGGARDGSPRYGGGTAAAGAQHSEAAPARAQARRLHAISR